jgi:hypothetical protein
MLRAERDQVLAYRVAACGLAARLPAERLLDAAGACGIQDSPPGNAPPALAARVDGLSPAAVTDALEVQRSLVETWSLRGAPHVLPTSDLAVFTLGAEPADEESLRSLLLGSEWEGSTATAAVATVLDAVLAVLDEGPRTKAQLSEALHGRLPDRLEPWCVPCGAAHVRETVLRAAALSGRFCFGGSVDGRPALVPTERWLGTVPTDRPQDARAALLRRFLRCLGPAGPKEFAEWAGLGLDDARRSFDSAEPELVGVELDRRRLWLHAGDVAAFLSPAPAAGARLLPANDPFLSQRDREVLAPGKALRQRIWRPLGNPGLLLLDGRPAALWRPRKQGRRLTVLLEPLAPLPPGALREVEAEATRLAPFRGCAQAAVEVTGE